jgi:hypothetical protein
MEYNDKINAALIPIHFIHAANAVANLTLLELPDFIRHS